MQIKKIILLIIIIMISTTTSSCYDSTDVDDMVYVLAIGIDQENENLTQFTFQTAVPLNISGGVETSFAESEESGSIQNLRISSDNLFSAIESANRKLAKKINISHCKIILFSENITDHSLNQNIDYTNNYADFRPDTLVAICEGDAFNYLESISSPFEKNPARYYEMFFNKNFSLQTFNTEINEFEKRNILTVPHLRKNGDTKAVVIKDYQKVTTLSEDEAIALNALTGRIKSGTITIPHLNLAVEIHKASRPKIHVDTTQNIPKFKIKLNFYGNILNETSDSSDSKKQIELHIAKLCHNLLYKSSQVLNSDIADLIRFSKPNFLTSKAFEKYDWQNKYRLSEFEVTVNYKPINK